MKTRAELDAMSHQELKDYEQSLLALWTPRMAIESDIERLSTHHSELLEVFNQLKNPDAPKNSRLKDSILSLKGFVAQRFHNYMILEVLIIF